MHTTTLTKKTTKTIAHRFTEGDTVTDRKTGDRWSPLWTVRGVVEFDGEPCYRLTFEDGDRGTIDAQPTTVEFCDEKFGRLGGEISASRDFGLFETEIDVEDDVDVEHDFEIGDRVSCDWEDCRVCPLTVEEILLDPDGSPLYRIDGTTMSVAFVDETWSAYTAPGETDVEDDPAVEEDPAVVEARAAMDVAISTLVTFREGLVAGGFSPDVADQIAMKSAGLR